MSDKVYELLEKMYIEFNGKFARLETKMENEVTEKINVLFDNQVEFKDSLSTINLKLDKLTAVHENYELRLRILEGKIKNMTV